MNSKDIVVSPEPRCSQYSGPGKNAGATTAHGGSKEQVRPKRYFNRDERFARQDSLRYTPGQCGRAGREKTDAVVLTCRLRM
jgi:hypothetical protein